jgi:hypothetical protein
MIKRNVDKNKRILEKVMNGEDYSDEIRPIREHNETGPGPEKGARKNEGNSDSASNPYVQLFTLMWWESSHLL